MTEDQEPGDSRSTPKLTGGRPTSYTADIASEICERIGQGETLRQICRDEAMPARSTVQKWVIDDFAGFSGQYARAREMQFESWADEISEISDDGSNDWMRRQSKDGAPGWQLNGEHVQRSRLRVDSRKWLLSKLNPNRYGDSLRHTGPQGGAVQTDQIITIRDLIVDPKHPDG